MTKLKSDSASRF